MNFLTVDNVTVKNRTKLVLRYFIIPLSMFKKLEKKKKLQTTYEFSIDSMCSSHSLIN